MAIQKAEGASYRPEIQGLRTIGALLVAGFHIWGARVSGGVDVFFVVSGFLISGSLYRELQRTQSINILGFWMRIAKRIAPLAYTVLAFTTLAALLWMPRSEQGGYFAEFIYSSFHLENIKLMLSAVDYLARDDAPSPVQQFWALSVQMQFYAVWPLLLIAAAFTVKKFRLGDWLYPAFLAGLVFASLVYSIAVTCGDPSPAYFNTFARIWEFGLGGILAIVIPGLSLPRKIRVVMGWCGLLAIVSCGFVLPGSMSFPGYVALWPVLGAAFVLIAGNSGTGLGVERVLTAKPLVRFGEFSFGFYLWHWPILVFALLLTEQTELGLVGGLFVIVMAACCAFLTHRWIEQPVQHLVLDHERWRELAWRMGAAALALGVAYGAIVAVRGQMNDNKDVVAAYRSMPLEPSISLAVQDIPRIYPDQCNQTQNDPELITCTYGNAVDPAKTIALVGSSHSAHWFPALESLAMQNRWRLVVMTKHGCPLSAEPFGHESCEVWNDAALNHLVATKPDAVFTTSTRPVAPGASAEGRIEHVPEGYLKQWERLEEAGVMLIALRDTPWIKIKVPACLEGAPSKGIDCGRPRQDILDEVDPVSMLDSIPENVAFIDLTDQFCDRSMCPPVRNNMIIYRDGSHLTATYAESLASVLGKRMMRVRPDLFPVEAKSVLTKAERS